MFQSLLLSGLVMGQAPVTLPPTPVETAGTPRVKTVMVGAPATDPLTAQPAPASNGALPTYAILEEPAKEPRTSTIVGTVYPLKMATEGEPASKFSGSVTLNQDSFFGFYPILSGAYAINDRFALTFYGLLWNNPGFTPSGTTGTGLWTEVGVGFSFTALDGLVTVNPQVGFLNGSLLSGADRSIAFEGVVSQISVSHAGKYTEGQVYAAYYTATADPTNNNFLHYWITGGFRPFADSEGAAQIISTGFHFEQLYQTKAKAGDASNIYTWIGPYVQFTLPNNVFMRVNGGWDLEDTVSETFYKVTLGYVF